MKGILARKIGMTRVICSESGLMTPVTLLEVSPSSVLEVKTTDNHGYAAAVLGAFERKKFGKNENKKFKFIKELLLEEGQEIKKGDSLDVSTLEGVEKVKITGVSKGRGFMGVVKRYNFSRGPETHGSHHHREPGSVGTCAKPARILKGKKMPGHQGAAKVTVQNVKVVQIDTENNMIALKGAVPGAKNGFVFIRE
ncbi:50S ribosomal protein L3 [Candidatus Gracilibacteria bacterium]|nr:50S ribosomal protein L3 [Candidatus Gracilibacteria bacterium]